MPGDVGRRGGEDDGGAGDLGGWRCAFRPATVLAWMLMVILTTALLDERRYSLGGKLSCISEVLRTHDNTTHNTQTNPALPHP